MGRVVLPLASLWFLVQPGAYFTDMAILHGFPDKHCVDPPSPHLVHTGERILDPDLRDRILADTKGFFLIIVRAQPLDHVVKRVFTRDPFPGYLKQFEFRDPCHAG